MKNSLLKLLALFVVLSLLANGASAGTKIKPGRKLAAIGGLALLGAAGYGVYQASKANKKGCDPVPDPETLGRIKCVPIAPVSTTTEKSSTYDLRKSLNAERKSKGLSPNPEGCDAHHIVPAGENRKWARKFATTARTALEGCVDLDSAENGIYLPAKTGGGAACDGSYHPSLHTRPYYRQLSLELEGARQINGCSGVRSVLQTRESRTRDLGPSDSRQFVAFLDSTREHGWEASRDLFPDKWEWYGGDHHSLPVPDMPYFIGAGIALSPRAMDLCRKAFPGELDKNLRITIDGHVYFWISPSFAAIEALSAKDFDRNIFVDGKRYDVCFSERFVDVWNSARPPLLNPGFVPASFERSQ